MTPSVFTSRETRSTSAGAYPEEAFREAMFGVLGYAPDAIERGKLHRFPTSGRRGDNAGWCRLFEDGLGGVFGCHRSGTREHWSPERFGLNRFSEDLALSRSRPRESRNQDRQTNWLKQAAVLSTAWARSTPVIPGDPVDLYLKARLAAESVDVPSCIRLAASELHWNDGATSGPHPVMVAQVSAPGGQVVALHRTYLTSRGNKADVYPVKKLTRTAGSLTGASIRLAPPTPGGALGVAEGIETALAAQMGSGVPTVAAYSAGGLATFEWPGGVGELIVFADADAAGAAAAEALAIRAHRAGCPCKVLTPSVAGLDWCDIWADRHRTLKLAERPR